MTLSCLHTHTTFCDGAADMETMCQAAFDRGFESIGFSSHAPIAKKTGIKSGWHLPGERLDEYLNGALAARRRWKGRLRVFLSLEVDYIQDLCGPADRDIQELPLDYVIGAVHYVLSPKTGEPVEVDCAGEKFLPILRDRFDNDGSALCDAYYDAYGAMIRAGGCDILAHMDLVKKNNGPFGFFSPGDPRYTRRLAEMAAAAERLRRTTPDRPPVVEVNTGGLIRGRTAECYPSRDLLRLLRERDIPLTINADAHAPEHLGGFYGQAREDMLAAGYTAALIFQGREDGASPWREERL
ncbi:MAG: histidinol-phosphatase [Treponema sp.]|jgi:histidinol-phosphatase (PHP family)|nr:histidinol-phosphatase [Treponema sp.]